MRLALDTLYTSWSCLTLALRWSMCLRGSCLLCEKKDETELCERGEENALANNNFTKIKFMLKIFLGV